MSERNLISNGRFVNRLAGWTSGGSAQYLASDGDEHYGLALLGNGDSIAQSLGVGRARSYTLHLAVKAGAELEAGNATVTIADSDGSTVISKSLNGDDSGWTENTFTVGLAAGSYTITIANAADVSVRVDDIWLWYVPIQRAGIAAQVHAKLGGLATGKGLNPVLSGALSEGDYTYAIDSGLRQVGAIDPETDTIDIRCLATSELDTLLDIVTQEMLERLHSEYAMDVDLTAGPRRESFSQTAKAIESVAGSGGGGKRVVMRMLQHGEPTDE